MRSILFRTTPAILFLLALAGCSVTTHDKGNGKKDDVDIKTPFGSLSVKEGASDVKDTGLSPYPGARVAKSDDDDDRHHSANVNISSSLFGLKVVALKYESDDPSDKVLSFYRKEMGKYGKVVDCTGGFSMNFHHHDKDAESPAMIATGPTTVTNKNSRWERKIISALWPSSPKMPARNLLSSMCAPGEATIQTKLTSELVSSSGTCKILRG